MKISPKRDILYCMYMYALFAWNLPIIIIITSLVSLLHIHVHLYTPHVHVFIFMQEALYFKANILHMHIPVSHVSTCSRQVWRGLLCNRKLSCKTNTSSNYMYNRICCQNKDLYLWTMTGLFLGIWFHLWITRIPIPLADAGCNLREFLMVNTYLCCS